MSDGYRGDVDGLRAISVALVILFHLGLPGLGGGFIGVDVFFVISGFLITGVIFEEIEADSFSLVRFYDRRARRILPMLVTMVLASAIAGYVLLYPGDYRAFSFSAIATLLGWSNIFFFRNTGYFDIPSQTMPLLHSWSLGVEEQFYLVWPVALVAGSKLFGRSKRVWVVIFTLVILMSFGRALTLAGRDPKADFYLPFTRAWELALGALIVVLPPAASFLPRALIGALPVIGLAAIGYGTTTLSAEAPFPAFNALLPTLGAALVIFPRATTAQAVLGAWPLRFVGLISYSLYLWHWPAIVFWRVYSNSLSPPWWEMLAIVVSTIALSMLSWWLIEQPVRRIRISTPAVLTSAMIANAITLAIMASILYADGFPGRLPPEMAALDGKDRMWAWKCPQSVALGILANSSMTTAPSCAYGADWKTARHRAIIWGDSLAEHLAPILDVAGRKTDTSIALAYACAAITQPGAPRNIAADLTPRYEDWCDAARTRVLSLITGANDIDTVLLSTSWSFLWPLLDLHSEAKARDILRAGLEDLLDKIIAAGKRPVIVADVPASLGPDPANCVLALHALPRRPCALDPAFIDLATIRSQIETHAMLKRQVALHPEAAIVDPMDFLCDATNCKKFVAGELIYRDAVHLRRNLSPAAISAIAEGMRLDLVFGRP